MDEWREAAKYLWGVLVPIGAWAWKAQDGRIGRVEERMVTREQLAERKHEVDKQLELRQQGEAKLHERINQHIQDEQEVRSALLQEMRHIGAAVARIEGRLDK